MGIKRIWLPAIVALLGVATTVSAWETLRQERRARESQTLATIAIDSRRAIEAAAERQIEGMRDLAASWARFGSRSPSAWRFEAGRTLEVFPGLVRLGWVDENGAVVRMSQAGPVEAPSDAAEVRALTALADRLGDHRRVRMVGPEEDGVDGWSYDLVVPTFQRDAPAGVLVARVAIGRMLDSVLHDSAPGYAVSLSWDGTPIYARGDAADTHPWWESRGAVSLSPGIRWETRYLPTEALAAASLSRWPDSFLAGGVLISLLLALLVHQLHSAEGEVRNLDDLNRELERRVDERTRELADAVTELEAFNYSVSHDLRSPLGSILTFTAVLEEDFGKQLDDEALAIIDRIRRSGEDSLALLDGLLELSRAGRAELHPERTDLAALAREVWAEVSTGSGEVRFEVGSVPPAWGDPALLRKVLANLLGNAVAFSATRGEAHIQLGGERRGDENVYFVQDDGIGFDMRYVGKLFKPFERLHGKSGSEGPGIGLAVVRRIVERHGGRVWAEGRADAGATFGFSLPAKGGAA